MRRLKNAWVRKLGKTKNDRIKVLFFLNTSLIGGAENNVLDLVTHLDKNKFDPWIAALEPGGPLLDYARGRNLNTFDPQFSHYFLPSYIIRIIRFLMREKFDAIFIFGFKLKLFLLPLSFALGIPLRIATILGLDTWKNKIHYTIERLLNRFATLWQANSMAAKKRAVEKEGVSEARVTVIYQGLEVDDREAWKQKAQKPASLAKFRIAVLANIKPGKGHFFFLKAIQPLLLQNSEIEVVLIGKDYTNGEIQDFIVQSGLSGSVKLAGYVADVRTYLRAFDLMVLPSFAESFPTSIIESMLEGVPVVSTKVGGIPELIEHQKTGWLINPGNEEELKEAVLTLRNNPGMRLQIAEVAYRMARQRFDIKQVTLEYERFIENHLMKKRSFAQTKVMIIQSRIVIGGPAVCTILLSKALNDEKFSALLVGGGSNPDERSLVEHARQIGIRCIEIPRMGREIHFYDDIISLIKLYRLIKKEKPAVVHTHTAKAGAVGRAAAFIAGVPAIFHTFHGHVFYGYFGKFRTGIFIFLERILAKFSTAVIVISEAQRFDIAQKYRIAPEKKVRLIPLGFEWDLFFHPSQNIDLREKYKIPSGKFLIGMVGRIVPIKDHALFVEIANRLLKHDPSQFHFIVIGDGELRNQIEEKVHRNNIAGSFTFTGWLDLNSSAYQCLDLMLLTSQNEGTPVTIIEALASGVPVIAAGVGGVPDVMKKYDPRFLVKDRDPESFVQSILDAIKDGHRVPREVSERIIQYYSAERFVKDTKQLYFESLNRA